MTRSCCVCTLTERSQSPGDDTHVQRYRGRESPDIAGRTGELIVLSEVLCDGGWTAWPTER